MLGSTAGARRPKKAGVVTGYVDKIYGRCVRVVCLCVSVVCVCVSVCVSVCVRER